MRITSVVAAILAGVFFVFPVIYGVRSDERVDKFLEKPSVKDKFENAADNKTKSGKSRVSPLVEQAEAYALYLNPVKQAARKTPKGAKTPNISDKVSVTPKFPVYATIYYPEDPKLSQALIDEPGRGRHWVRQSSMVGHLLIEQIKDGLVVVKGSKETFELEIEEKPATKSPSRPSSTSSLRSSQRPIKSKPTSSAFSRAAAARRTTNVPQKLQRNDEKMGELVDKLKDLQEDPDTGETNLGLDKEERSARISELISKFKSTRVSAEEAKKLGNIGEELKGIRKDANPSPPEASKSKGKVSPPKPDTSAEK
ncbi:hypothetical protein ACFL3Q_04660 [Planctomycetota bacterium]